VIPHPRPWIAVLWRCGRGVVRVFHIDGRVIECPDRASRAAARGPRTGRGISIAACGLAGTAIGL